MLYVIIPIYNCREYIEQAVKSVINQLYKNIRIIIVDDGSTDGSSQLCDALKNEVSERIEVIHKKNKGVSAARNAGIDYVIKNRVSEEKCYIAFLDADDAWSENIFDNNIEVNLNSGYNLIIFEQCLTDQSMQKRTDVHRITSGEYRGGCDSIYIEGDNHFGAILYDLELLDSYNIRFDESLKYSEDKVFKMQCLYLAKNILIEDKLLYLYRQHDSSAMKRRKKGIAYYPPIINGWIESDLSMSKYKNEERGEFCGGRILAGIYIMEMIREHYMSFGREKALNDVWQQNPGWNEISELKREDVSAKRYKDFMFYKNHHNLFKYKCRLEGLIYAVMRRVCKIPIIRKWRNNRRFYIDISEVN